MKAELKKLKGTTIKILLGEITLRDYYRLDQSEYDQIYFKTTGIDGLCKLYSLGQPASTERFHNQIQQNQDRLSMMYDRVHCEEVKIKKFSYGLVLFMKLDKDPSLRDCMSTLTGFERMKLTIALVELLQQLRQKKKIYCNIRPSNIFKVAQGFKIINYEYLRSEADRVNIDSFMLETIQNNWQYWPTEVTDPYSNQKFDYALDVYAVGCILYELVSGRYPFESKLSANSNQYIKLQSKNLISKIAQLFLSPIQNRRCVNFKQLLQKLHQSNNQLRPTQDPDPTMPQNQKTQKSGIFDNISNVFSKMMNDSQGWFLNYVQDSEQIPNQKYLDNILTKMYKKQEKCDKLSSIITRFIGNSAMKNFAVGKTLLIIGQFLRKGPEATFTSFTVNVSNIKSIGVASKDIQALCVLLEKKIELAEKLKKTMTGNFYVYDLTAFSKLTIQDIALMTTYLQHLISYLQSLIQSQNSILSQAIINFTCDQIYDLVSSTIISIISIRKDNDLQLRNDNTKQLQPIQRKLNTYLKKLSNLSNYISAHALYSLEGQYIPYQEEIMMKAVPYYTSLQFFYGLARNYKGLTVPVCYAHNFGSSYGRDQKKNAHSVNKDVVKESKSFVFDADSKNYFEDENNSDDEGGFNKSSKVLRISTQSFTQKSPQQYPQKPPICLQLLQPQIPKQSSCSSSFLQKPNNQKQQIQKNQSTIQKTQKSNKAETTISFQQFGNITKTKSTNSPLKAFNQFNFFNEDKKYVIKKPPLPDKKDNGKLCRSNFIDFQDFFQKGTVKNSLEIGKKQVQQPNFDAFNSLLNIQNKPETVSPLVQKILAGLKLKQLKDLLQKHKNYIIDFKQLKTIKVIGSGSAGEVFLGKYGEDVAIKKVKAKQNPNALKQFERELVTYIKIKKNPHLVSLVGLSEDAGNFYLITEFCQSGSLFDLLHKRKLDIVLSWKQRLNFAIQIAQGMLFLHSMKPIIIHRDLKSLNVFVTRVNNAWKMKVADFGLSRSPEADMMTTQLGTIHWMAPELLEGKQYSFKVDIYSYGVLLWEILSRTTPYSNLQNPMAILKYVVIDKKRPNMESIPKQCPPLLIAVMEKCWAHEPNDRPTFSQIIKELRQITL